MSVLNFLAELIKIILIFITFIPAFYIPGRCLLGSKIELKEFSLHVISVIVGICIWAWQGYVFGILNVRWLSYLYIIFFIFIFFKNKYLKDIGRFNFKLNITNLVILVIVMSGVFAQTSPYFNMGISTTEGLRFNRLNNEDHIWHASLVRELVNRFPPNEPAISDVALKDYHYWYNLVSADLIRVFNLPFYQTQFVGLYSLCSMLLAGIGYLIAKEIYNKTLFIGLSLFFLFYSGDISVWVTYLIQKKFIFTIHSLVNNATRFNDSPAFSFSIIIGLAAFYIILVYKERLKINLAIIVSLMFISLLEFKVYTGITFIAGLMILCTFYFFKKKYIYGLLISIILLIGSIVFFSTTSTNAGIFLLPFETPRNFIAQKEFGLFDWELRWHIYFEHNNYIRLLQYGIYMSCVYLITQFGPLILGLILLKKSFLYLKLEYTIFLYSVAGSGIISALFFYQKVGGANIWEFLLPVIIILCFLTALNLTVILENKHKLVKYFSILLIMILLLPRWIYSVKNNLFNEVFNGFHGVSIDELASYNFLSQKVGDQEVILSLNDYEDHSYSSKTKMITGKQLYLSGLGVRQLITPEIQRRIKIVNNLKVGKIESVLGELKKDNVKYLYYSANPPLGILNNINTEIVFRNNVSTILKISK